MKQEDQEFDNIVQQKLDERTFYPNDESWKKAAALIAADRTGNISRMIKRASAILLFLVLTTVVTTVVVLRKGGEEAKDQQGIAAVSGPVNSSGTNFNSNSSANGNAFSNAKNGNAASKNTSDPSGVNGTDASASDDHANAVTADGNPAVKNSDAASSSSSQNSVNDHSSSNASSSVSSHSSSTTASTQTSTAQHHHAASTSDHAQSASTQNDDQHSVNDATASLSSDQQHSSSSDVPQNVNADLKDHSGTSGNVDQSASSSSSTATSSYANNYQTHTADTAMHRLNATQPNVDTAMQRLSSTQHNADTAMHILSASSAVLDTAVQRIIAQQEHEDSVKQASTTSSSANHNASVNFFFAEAGMTVIPGNHFSLNIYGGSSWPGSSVNPMIGAGYEFHIGGSFGMQAGLRYTSVGNISDSAKSYYNVKYSFGSQGDLTEIQMKRLHYFQIPLSVHWHFAGRNSLFAGASINYLFATGCKRSVTTYSDGFAQQAQSGNEFGYGNSLNRFDALLTAGYGFQFGEHFSGNASYYYGVSKLKNGDMYSIDLFSRNRGFMLSFQYSF